MKPVYRLGIRTVILVMLACPVFFGQDRSQEQEKGQEQAETKPEAKEIQISITLKSGEVVRGTLVKIDSDSVDFKVKDVLQSVPTNEVSNVRFGDSGLNLKPTILYKENAEYTREARDHGVQGVVVLSVVFTADAKITNIQVIRGLPAGLTEKAIEAAKKIRFKPAIKDGQPVSVRGNLEFSFFL